MRRTRTSKTPCWPVERLQCCPQVRLCPAISATLQCPARPPGRTPHRKACSPPLVAAVHAMQSQITNPIFTSGAPAVLLSGNQLDTRQALAAASIRLLSCALFQVLLASSTAEVCTRPLHMQITGMSSWLCCRPWTLPTLCTGPQDCWHQQSLNALTSPPTCRAAGSLAFITYTPWPERRAPAPGQGCARDACQHRHQRGGPGAATPVSSAPAVAAA